ncbi:hypothetical protein [Alkalihalobacillus deserti]|nr:hypothetical protein [Alkalihalobacillus deserti]
MLKHLYEVLEKIKDLPETKQKKVLSVFEKIVSERVYMLIGFGALVTKRL